MRRTGVIARKLGMTSLFREDGSRAPVTVLQLDSCRVVGVRTLERDGYSAVRLGAGSARPRRIGKARAGQFAKEGVEPSVRVAEFRIDAEDALLPVGSELSPSHFVIGQWVDVAGVTSGKGFAGSMKRHGYKGGRATHGTSVAHRAHGSTGNHQDPGRVWRGKKMAGHMGARRRTALNLEVLATEVESGLIFVRGSVPSVQGEWVLIRDAVKRPPPADVPFPAALLEGAPPPEAKSAPEADTPTPTPEAETPTPEAETDTGEKS